MIALVAIALHADSVQALSGGGDGDGGGGYGGPGDGEPGDGDPGDGDPGDGDPGSGPGDGDAPEGPDGWGNNGWGDPDSPDWGDIEYGELGWGDPEVEGNYDYIAARSDVPDPALLAKAQQVAQAVQADVAVLAAAIEELGDSGFFDGMELIGLDYAAYSLFSAEVMLKYFSPSTPLAQKRAMDNALLAALELQISLMKAMARADMTEDELARVQAYLNHVINTPVYEQYMGLGPQEQIMFGSAAELLDRGAEGSPLFDVSLPVPQKTRFAAGHLGLMAGQRAYGDGVYLLYQSDGDLVAYTYPDDVRLWSSGTGGRGCLSWTCEMVFQADGNLVLYQFGVPYWASNTVGASELTLSAGSPALAIYQGDRELRFSSNHNAYIAPGKLVLPAGSELRTSSLILAYQTDGNFVLYDLNYRPLWVSFTAGYNCAPTTCRAVYQGDGNLVLYSNGAPYWATNTNGHAYTLRLSATEPHLTLIDEAGHIRWN